MFARFDWAHSFKRLGLLVVLVLTLVAASGAAIAYGSTTVVKRYVSPVGTDVNNSCLTLSNPCKTINHALFVAAPGDEIRPAGGTYQENINIDKSILIEGADLATTVIDGGAAARTVGIVPGATVTISDLRIQNGKLAAAEGAGISNAGTLTLKHVIVANNTSTGGDLANDNGGGIWNHGTLTLESSYVTGNHADNLGGGIYIQGGWLTVKDSVISSNNAREGGGIESQGQVTLIHSQIANNLAQESAGGFASFGQASLSDVTISGNAASSGSGGGMMQESQERPATLANVTLRNNLAHNNGGGLYNDSNAVSLSGVTFDSNTALNGGGLYNTLGTVTLTNVTFGGNVALGGGLFNANAGTAALLNVTFNGNVSTGTVGSAIYNTSIISLKNTLVANDLVGANCYNLGSFTDNGHNLDSGFSCGFSAANHDLNIDPLLGPLQNNGGYTDTFALDKGSPAINQGTDNGCPTQDQRGKTRITTADPTCDIGSYEYP